MLVAATSVRAQTLADFRIPKTAPAKSVLVVGFLGGFERWNDAHRGVRKVALSLQSMNLRDVYVATVENHRQNVGTQLIERFVGSKTERAHGDQPRVILYGQSWGGAAVIHVAKELRKEGISVDLTIQVDSVGLHDWAVPANVRYAANLFQRDLPGICGRARIEAEDPQATQILENTQMSYLLRPYSTLHEEDASWLRRTLGGSHAKMEVDEVVWAHVLSLIEASVHDKL